MPILPTLQGKLDRYHFSKILKTLFIQRAIYELRKKTVSSKAVYEMESTQIVQQVTACGQNDGTKSQKMTY